VVEFTGLFWVTTVAKLVALILGSFIVYLAYKGYRRNAAKPLLYTSIGFALITLGTIAEGIVYIILGAGDPSYLLPALATGTTITVLGFLVIILSIYSVKSPSSSSVGMPKSVTMARDGGRNE
jgi:hypothetical protein